MSPVEPTRRVTVEWDGRNVLMFARDLEERGEVMEDGA